MTAMGEFVDTEGNGMRERNRGLVFCNGNGNGDGNGNADGNGND